MGRLEGVRGRGWCYVLSSRFVSTGGATAITRAFGVGTATGVSKVVKELVNLRDSSLFVGSSSCLVRRVASSGVSVPPRHAAGDHLANDRSHAKGVRKTKVTPVGSCSADVPSADGTGSANRVRQRLGAGRGTLVTLIIGLTTSTVTLSDPARPDAGSRSGGPDVPVAAITGANGSRETPPPSG